MQENWLELYNRHQNSKKPSGDVEFDTFMELSEECHVKVDSQIAWNCIKGKLQKDHTSSGWLRVHGWKVAAAVVLLIASFVVWMEVDSNSYQTIAINAAEQSKDVTLPDGSHIFLSQGSTLTYPVPFEKRRVSFQGLGYFEIEKDHSAFSIELNNQSIVVLGTAFSVNSTPESTQVYVEHGVVEFSANDQKKKVSMHQQLNYNIENNLIAVTQDIDPNILSWKTGEFIFKNTPFSDVVKHLEKYYHVRFSDTDRFGSCYITARFEQEELSHVLKILEPILDARFERNNSNIQTVGKGCN